MRYYPCKQAAMRNEILINILFGYYPSIMTEKNSIGSQIQRCNQVSQNQGQIFDILYNISSFASKQTIIILLGLKCNFTRDAEYGRKCGQAKL